MGLVREVGPLREEHGPVEGGAGRRDHGEVVGEVAAPVVREHGRQAADGSDQVGPALPGRGRGGPGEGLAGGVQDLAGEGVAGLGGRDHVDGERRRHRGDPVAGREGAGQPREVAVPRLGPRQQGRRGTAAGAGVQRVPQRAAADPGPAAVVAQPVAEAVDADEPAAAQADGHGPGADRDHRSGATGERTGVRDDRVGGQHELAGRQTGEQGPAQVGGRFTAGRADRQHVERRVVGEPGLASYDRQAGRDRGPGRIGAAGVGQPSGPRDPDVAQDLAVADGAHAAGRLAEVDAGDQTWGRPHRTSPRTRSAAASATARPPPWVRTTWSPGTSTSMPDHTTTASGCRPTRSATSASWLGW